MKRKININLLLLQGIGYRLFAVIGSTLITWALTKQFHLAWKVGLGINALHMGLYYVYHYFFLQRNKFNVPPKKFVLWFTGLPCSGKTTIADEVAQLLKCQQIRVERLDGDIVRNQGLSNDLGFSPEDRKKNLFRVAFVARLLSKNNVAVLASFVSPNKEVRDIIRGRVINYIEVSVRCLPEICSERDVKGMWKRARNGEIKNFTGYNASYEYSLNAEITIETDYETIEESAKKVMDYLKKERYI